MTTVYVFLALAALALVFGVVGEAVAGSRKRVRKIRRRELTSACHTINQIDVIVSRYYPTTDIVGQAMGDEIRDIIHNHRKVITTR